MQNWLIFRAYFLWEMWNSMRMHILIRDSLPDRFSMLKMQFQCVHLFSSVGRNSEHPPVNQHQQPQRRHQREAKCGHRHMRWGKYLLSCVCRKKLHIRPKPKSHVQIQIQICRPERYAAFFSRLSHLFCTASFDNDKQTELIWVNRGGKASGHKYYKILHYLPGPNVIKYNRKQSKKQIP